MTDSVKLRKRLDASGYKLRYVAEQCGLTYQGFLPKLNGEREFVQSEIMAIAKLLGLSQQELREIFFAEEHDETSSLADA